MTTLDWTRHRTTLKKKEDMLNVLYNDYLSKKKAGEGLYEEVEIDVDEDLKIDIALEV